MNGKLNTPKINKMVAEIAESFETIVRIEVAAVVNGEELKQKRIDREMSTIDFAVTGFGGLKAAVAIRENDLTETWRNEAATEKQIAFIQSLGGSAVQGMTKGVASDLIDVLKDMQTRAEVIRRRAIDVQNLYRNTLAINAIIASQTEKAA